MSLPPLFKHAHTKQTYIELVMRKQEIRENDPLGKNISCSWMYTETPWKSQILGRIHDKLILHETWSLPPDINLGIGNIPTNRNLIEIWCFHWGNIGYLTIPGMKTPAEIRDFHYWNTGFMTVPGMESSGNTGFMTIPDMESRQKLEVSIMKCRIHEDSRP